MKWYWIVLIVIGVFLLAQTIRYFILISSLREMANKDLDPLVGGACGGNWTYLPFSTNICVDKLGKIS